MSKRDYYEVLGVVKSVSDDELKKAFRKMAIQHHPDRNPGDKSAEEKFKELNEAYQVLSDPQRKAAYDQFGHAGLGGMGGGSGQGFGGFTDIFDNLFNDIFGGGSGGGQRGGVDLRYQLQIAFEEAVFGVEKKIHFEKESVCDTCRGSGAKEGTKSKACKQCKGSGQVRFNQGFFVLTRTCTACSGRGETIEDKCGTCRGAGRTKKKTEVVVKIPAGIDSGQRLRLKGEGEAGAPGGSAGDLYVEVLVQDHALFRREGEHIILEMPISLVQAALGSDMEVPTIGGTTQLKVPAGTQSGELFRLKGKGIRRLNGSGFGDQVVRVHVEVPQKLTRRQRELLEEFEREGSIDSQPGVSSFAKKFREIFRS